MLEAGEKSLAVEAGRNRIEKLDPDRARMTLERAPAPEQAGIERHRQAWRAGFRVQVGDAGFVGRRCAGRAPRALGKNDDLAAARQLEPGTIGHAPERLASGAAIDR